MRDALIAVLGELRAERPGPGTDALTWPDLQDDRAAVAEELAGIEFNLARLRVLGFTRTLAGVRAAQGGDETADAALAERIAVSYFEHRDHDPALFPDTLPCLQALRDRYRLGLLSNGSRLPERVGLAGYFESVVFAQDHTVAKPDKGIFEVVERELGLPPTTCVLVGDHPLNDVVGAKRAGWHAVWLNRKGKGAVEGAAEAGRAFWQLHDDDERPDAVVSSLSDLPVALESLDSA